MKNGKLLFLALLGVAISACGGKPLAPSAAAARDFVEAYYVKADLTQAAALSDSLALEKVKTDVQLRDGQSIDASTHQPHISFKPLEEHVEADTATYLYLLTLKPQDASTMEKKALIRVRQAPGGAWKVTQFSDYDVEGSTK